MEASIGNRAATAAEYLMVWIGALGKYVGLNVPLSIIQGRHVDCAEGQREERM